MKEFFFDIIFWKQPYRHTGTFTILLRKMQYVKKSTL